MNLNNLNDLELVENTKNLVGEEKQITERVLEYLEEIERRRVYAKRGFSSLFDFCTKELGYSESSAQRRISSMRLIRNLPEAKAKLQSGSVNLSTLSQLQTYIRKEEVIKKTTLNHDKKLELLVAIENKSQSACEKVFIERTPETVLKTKESTRPLSENLTEVRLVISSELEAKLNELKNLLAHQNKSNSTAELVEILADMALQKLKSKSTAAAAPHLRERPESRASVRRQVWRRDLGQCQYSDPLTGRKCLSSFKLEIDHIVPQALGGDDALENLRLYCRTHNELAAINIFSAKHMVKFIPSLNRPDKN